MNSPMTDKDNLLQRVDNLLKPQAVILGQFLADRDSVGLYIPPYQRYFSWGEEQFERFFEDVVADIQRKSQPRHYMTFLGSVICFDDDDGNTMDPKPKSQQPERVYNIVDGQQRLICVCMLAVFLHKLIGSDRYANLCSDGKWFEKQAKQIREKLRSMISVQISGKDTPSPKIIRAIFDEWADTSENERFHSPIAHFLNQYLAQTRKNKIFKYDSKLKLPLRTIPKDLKTEHRNFKKHLDKLEQILQGFCTQSQPEDKEIGYELDPVKKLLTNSLLMESVFKHNVKKECEEGRLDFNGPDKDEKEELFRALLLGNYIYRCACAIVVVTKRSYDRALVIYDALNATGRPLNAFETLKPEIIKLEMQEGASHSHKEYVDAVETDIKRKRTRKTTDAHVSDLVVSFALANSGKKLGKDLYEQRDYLRSTFTSHVRHKDQYQEYLSFLSTVSDMKHIFEDDEHGLDNFLQRRGIVISSDRRKMFDGALLPIRFLTKAGFTITISLLSIYLHQVLVSDWSKPAIEAFCDASRKTAAFCAIWRSSAETTNRIDDRIRKIMQGEHLKDKGDKWPPLSRYNYKSKENNTVLSTNQLGRQFISLLADMYDIKGAKSWAKKAGEIEIYKAHQVARFILLVGSHNTRVEKGDPPSLTVVKDNSVVPLIDSKAFDNPLFKTIEHVIPMKEDANESPYTKSEKNQLWNLTLIPMEVNAILGNKDWERKQEIYQYYSAENDVEQKQCFKKLKDSLSNEQFQRFIKNKNYGYLPMTKYLALLNADEFSKGLVQSRNEIILANCWKILATEWLGWPSKGGKR